MNSKQEEQRLGDGEREERGRGQKRERENWSEALLSLMKTNTAQLVNICAPLTTSHCSFHD